MGRGNVVSRIVTLPGTGNFVFQPTIGTEVMITELGSSLWTGATPNRTPFILVRLTNGTMNSDIRQNEQASLWSGGALKLFITNTVYLRINNLSTNTQILSFCGIQTK